MHNPFNRDNKMIGEMLRLRRLVDELVDENAELREEIEEWRAYVADLPAAAPQDASDLGNGTPAPLDFLG